MKELSGRFKLLALENRSRSIDNQQVKFCLTNQPDVKNEESKRDMFEADPFEPAQRQTEQRQSYFAEVKEISIKEDALDGESEQWSCYDEFFREEDRHNLSMQSKETIFCRSDGCDFRRTCVHQHVHNHCGSSSKHKSNCRSHS